MFHGINLWRGLTRAKPFLTGASVTRVGGLYTTGKLVIYPIRNNIDADGNQLLNWNTEIVTEHHAPLDWNAPGKLEDFFPIYKDWSFDWLDCADVIRRAELLLDISDGRPRSGGALELRARDAAGRRRAPDVSARRQWRRPGDHRRDRRSAALAAHARGSGGGAQGLRGAAVAVDQPDRAARTAPRRPISSSTRSSA